MARKPQRDRAGYKDFINISCPCGKRLALMDETLPGVADGPVFVRSDAKGFDPSGAPGGWFRFMCPRCRRDNRIKEGDLLDLLRAAKADGQHRVLLAA